MTVKHVLLLKNLVPGLLHWTSHLKQFIFLGDFQYWDQ